MPGAHPYVESLFSSLHGAVRLPDPIIDPGDPLRWWPPAMLDAQWVLAHADDFDVMHVHFGLESLPEGRLAGALDALERVDRPLVFTVHDLENPNLVDQSAHLRDLDLLIPRADALITLTDSAAAEVARRWGREAVVAPHPAIATVDLTTPVGHPSSAFTVGLHLRDMRPNIAAEQATLTLLDALDRLRAGGLDVRGRITVRERVRDRAAADRVLAVAGDRADCEVRVTPRSTDRQLEEDLADLDVAMLPYSHGTHSGWVELCRDLGVPVVGTTAGHMAHQHPDTFAAYTLGDGASLARAIQRAITVGSRPGTAERRHDITAHAALREQQTAVTAAAHLRVYTEVIGGEALGRRTA